MSWDITRQLLLPAAVGNVQGTLHVSTTRTTQPLRDAQNHVPAAYVIVRDFLSTDEVHKLHAWFVDPVSPATATTFDGEPLDFRLGHVDGLPIKYPEDKLVSYVIGYPFNFSCMSPKA